MAYDARKNALNVLNRLNREKKTLDTILSEVSLDDQRSPRRDRALFNVLVFGVLRWRGRLDYIIDYFSNTPLRKIEPAVLNILRLGLFQIIYLNRIPDSAAVNTSVELAKQSANTRAAGFVNALLRKATRHYTKVPFAAFANNPLAHLTHSCSLPNWIAQRWLKRFDPEMLAVLCKTINSIPPITLRTNTLKTTRDALILSLREVAAQVDKTPFAPDGLQVIRPHHSIPELPGFKDGLFQVQDEAAQLVSLLLNPRPGETVLDACAGRGGKTAHIAQLMQNSGSVVALDKDEKKLAQLGLEMKRLNISVVNTLHEDLNSPLDGNAVGLYDRVLVDAPCSGIGVLRRNPDIRWYSAEPELQHHARRQKRLLSNLSQILKPNGILVYSVCSVEPEENENVVDAFLKNHPEFVIDRSIGRLPERLHSQDLPKTGIKTLPKLDNMDGFFLIRLRKTE